MLKFAHRLTYAQITKNQILPCLSHSEIWDLEDRMYTFTVNIHLLYVV
jgi:hypothetical protein